MEGEFDSSIKPLMYLSVSVNASDLHDPEAQILWLFLAALNHGVPLRDT